MVNDPETLDPEAASRGPVKGSIQPRSTIMEARETRALRPRAGVVRELMRPDGR